MLNQLTAFGAISFVNFLSTFFLGCLALIKGRKSAVKVSYGTFVFSIAFYAFFYFLWQSSGAKEWSILLFKWTIVGVVLINATFVQFTYALLGIHQSSRNHLYLAHAINLFFCYGALFLFYQDWQIKYTYGLWPVPSNTFHVYLVWWFAQVIYCFYLIWKRGIIESSGRQRQQCVWVLGSCLVGYLGGATNWFVWYGIKFPPYLNGGIAIFAFILGYAIFRHQLLDIEVIIKKTLVFAGLSFFVFACFAVPFFLLTNVFQVSLGGQVRWWLFGSAGMLVAAVAGPLNAFLVNVTDKYLFQKKVDYRKLLKEATEYLAELVSLKWQARRVIAFLVYKARIKNASIYAFQSHAPGSVLLQASRPRLKVEGHKTIPFSHPIIQYMKTHRKPVTLSELEEERKKEESAGFPTKDFPPEDGSTFIVADGYDRRKLDEMLQLLKAHQAEAVIPCFVSDTAKRARKRKEARLIRGILFLGTQKSDEPYTEEDLDVFFTLGQESSIAFENARLYDEAVVRSRELETTNRELEIVQTGLLHALNETEEANKKLKVTQAELLEAKKRALLAGMSSAVAHEIRNPLTPIVGAVSLIRSRLTSQEKFYREKLALTLNAEEQSEYRASLESMVKYFSQIDRMVERIRGVVNTLINLVKERTGEKGQVHLKLVMAGALEEVRFQTYWEALAAPEIIQDIPTDLPFIYGITQDLQGVFVNLIINSFHAMRQSKEKKIRIEARLDESDSGMVRIGFEDTGCGIAKDHLERVFEHGFTTKGEKGTGIGLFYCKDNIERIHGGKIQVESELGKGTRFMIHLPVVKDANGA